MKALVDPSGGTGDLRGSRDVAQRIGRLAADIFTLDQPDGCGTSSTVHVLSTSQHARRSAAGTSAGAAAGFWFTAECLAGPALEPTVLVDAAGPHRFQRMLRGTDLARRAPHSMHQGLELLQRAVHEHQPVTTNLHVGRHRLPASCHPVFGPSGAIHALRMQVGAPPGSSEPVPLISLEFDTNNLIRFGRPDLPVPAHFHLDRTWTLPALLERVVWLDKRLELIALFDPIDPASRWCESLIMDDPVTNMRRHLWMAARAATDAHGSRVVRAIIADLTSIVPVPNRDPMTEHLVNRTARGHGSALMDLRTTMMHSFCCQDDPRMTLWRHQNPQLHPADMPAVLQAIADLASNRSAQAALRIRFSDDAPWITLHAICTPLANYSRPQANIDFWIDEYN